MLGVGGGIAAYKAPELVRRLRDAGAEVHVIVTKAGQRFVSTLALEVVSGHGVGVSLWETDSKHEIVHTDLGDACDLILLAPATANLIARMAHGFADDLLTTTLSASTTPVLICPSMNTDMWENPLVQRNLATLSELERFSVLTPGRGLLACGVDGAGRLPDPPQIVAAAARTFQDHDLNGVRVLVTAGPTREAIDPVRFLSNRSTGTMGFALAAAFVERGATVRLIAGPVNLATPVGVVERLNVTSASEMANAFESVWSGTDVVVMAAAVADYRPAVMRHEKWKKSDASAAIELERTTDILGKTASMPNRADKVVVGFAAETDNLEENARQKLEKKALDWIVANHVGGSETGFGSGDNEGVLYGVDGAVVGLERSDKQEFARAIVRHLVPSIRKKGAA